MKFTVDQTLNQAINAHKEGRLEDAKQGYKKMIELKPDNIVAHTNLGTILQTLGKLEEAEASYKKAIELNSEFAEAHYNLGNLLNKIGKLEEAEASYKKAIKINPDFIEAHHILAVTLHKLGKFEEAEESYKKVIKINPNYAEAYSNLGVTLRKLGRINEAIASYDKAIQFKINFTPALLNRGKILLNKGEFEASLKDFDACNNKYSRARALSSLHGLGRVKEIYQRIETHSELDDENLRVAAFASFIAEKEGKETAHNFCKNPLDFIHYSNISSHVTNSNSFISEVIKELNNTETVWEPTGKSTHKGFQSTSNLFQNPSEKINDLKSIVINEIDSYHLKFKDKDCSYIKKWPSKNNLRAWCVILKQQGYQTAHIHPSGWLSGVIYLKVVPHLGKNEGAIEFGLSGEYYSDTNSSTVTHQPKEGGVILFPSSLYHKTIPFTTDEDRIVVSFDLMPRNKNL